jgi:hypothetical protein
MADLRVGAIVHWADFEFPNGGAPKNKYLVLVAAKQGRDWLMLIANTNRHHPWLTPGCNAKDGYYLIPAVGKTFFWKDTEVWLRPIRTNAGELLARHFWGDVRLKDNLPENIAGAIRNCLKQTDDLDPDDADLL